MLHLSANKSYTKPTEDKIFWSDRPTSLRVHVAFRILRIIDKKTSKKKNNNKENSQTKKQMRSESFTKTSDANRTVLGCSVGAHSNGTLRLFNHALNVILSILLYTLVATKLKKKKTKKKPDRR